VRKENLVPYVTRHLHDHLIRTLERAADVLDRLADGERGRHIGEELEDVLLDAVRLARDLR
jgi:hypothetical protein